MAEPPKLTDEQRQAALEKAAEARRVRADVKELAGLIGQLCELRLEEPTDDYGVLRLEEAAFKTALELLTDATIVLATDYGTKMPYGCASTDSEGGLCIDWLRSDRAVNLVIPASDQTRRGLEDS